MENPTTCTSECSIVIRNTMFKVSIGVTVLIRSISSWLSNYSNSLICQNYKPKTCTNNRMDIRKYPHFTHMCEKSKQIFIFSVFSSPIPSQCGYFWESIWSLMNLFRVFRNQKTDLIFYCYFSYVRFQNYTSKFSFPQHLGFSSIPLHCSQHRKMANNL